MDNNSLLNGPIDVSGLVMGPDGVPIRRSDNPMPQYFNNRAEQDMDDAAFYGSIGAGGLGLAHQLATKAPAGPLGVAGLVAALLSGGVGNLSAYHAAGKLGDGLNNMHRKQTWENSGVDQDQNGPGYPGQR